jgi:hypothetical protein
MVSMSRSRVWSMLGGFLAVVPLLASAVPAYADDDEEEATTETDAAPDTTVQNGYEDTDPSAPTAFQSDLSPYGTWAVDDNYGTVWVPNSTVVGGDFAPYQTSGHWALTDDGEWLWVSDYSWGYIPFHYGRWLWIDGRGWSWIPGRAYASSWVVWRVGGDGYIGWAPMPPAYYWSHGAYVSIGSPLPAAYSFCDTGHVFDDNLHDHVYRTRAQVEQAAGGTHPFIGRHLYLPASPSIKDAHLSAETPPRHGVPDKNALSLSKRPPGPMPMSGSSKGLAGSSTTGRGAAETSRNIKSIEVQHTSNQTARNEATVAHTSSTSRAPSRETPHVTPAVAHQAPAGHPAPARPAQASPASHSRAPTSRSAARPANHASAPAVTPASSHHSSAPIRSSGGGRRR